MQMQPRREGIAANRHAQALHQALLIDSDHRQGCGEPGQKAQTDDERFQTAADHGEGPGGAEIDPELCLGAVQNTGNEIRPGTQDGENSDVEGEGRGNIAPDLAGPEEAIAHRRVNGEDRKFKDA